MRTLRSLALLAAVSLAVFAIVPHVHAQADLTFSGGNGAPLELTLDAPVTYLVTNTPAPASSSPGFDLQGVGEIVDNDAQGLTGTITFTINGGPAQTISEFNSGINGGSLALTDVYLFGETPGVAVGDVVALDAGTLTTTEDFANLPPASGSFQTFIFDSGLNRLDAVDGISVPEPSTWVMIGTSFALLVGILNYRLRQA